MEVIMNSFKKLVIKILCCAIVCAAIIPDVYGMNNKRKRDDEPNERNVRARTDERDGKEAKQEVKQEAPLELQADEDGISSSNSSNSNEAKQEVTQARKTNNIFSKLSNIQRGLRKPLTDQELVHWVGSLPDNSSPQHDPEVRDKTDTIIKIILHAPAQLPNFIQFYRMLPGNLYDEGSIRCLVLDALDKEAQKYYEGFIKDKKAPEQKDALKKLPVGYLKMKVRALQQGITSDVHNFPGVRVFCLRSIIECIATPENEISLSHNAIGMVKGLIGDVIDLLIQRDKLEPITSLDLSYNNLPNVKGLNQLRNLTELYLYFNRLTCIEGLGQLVKLTKLNLLQNRFKCIKGL